ncbi:MAG: hypothetical protein ACKOAU_06360, partial [Pirellula sp.]
MRQPELVGRTVPCPKCKNAIHVVRPGEVAWNPGAVDTSETLKGPANTKPSTTPKAPKRPISSVNSEAITKADPGDWDLDNLESALAQQSASDGQSDGQSDEGGFFRDPAGENTQTRNK